MSTRTFSHPHLSDCEPNDLIAFDAPFSNLYSSVWSKTLDFTTIVVSIDGACTGNGTSAACAGLGVYFGPGSWFNTSERVYGVQTNQRAELRAAISALETVEPEIVDDRDIFRVVLMSDSEYVVRGMTEWVFRWRENGYTNSRGRLVTNADDFQDLDQLIESLEDKQIFVEFWQVGREDNWRADELAKRACEL
jgi:ribonuclease HI